MEPPICIEDVLYDLPGTSIAERPLDDRTASRLMVVSRAHGIVAHERFRSIGDHLPPRSLVVRNTTRVVHARLEFKRPSGGRIEILLLNPTEPSTDPAVALGTCGEVTWETLIGGARKARRDKQLRACVHVQGIAVELVAAIADETQHGWTVRFTWSPSEIPFGVILQNGGGVPLPPYIRRESDERDRQDYQTVYARHEGAVAAPTAGLHFTPELIAMLAGAGHQFLDLALHVGAGTFRPLTGPVSHHVMHRERISVPTETVAALRHACSSTGERRPIVAVGTTSLRTLESLYWLGVRLLRGETIDDDLLVGQWDPYRLQTASSTPDRCDALNAVIRWCADRRVAGVTGCTQLFIVPGHPFTLVDSLITNFHQPASTLLLLVSALIGSPMWRNAYEEALARDYRFLSYGDAMLITP